MQLAGHSSGLEPGTSLSSSLIRLRLAWELSPKRAFANRAVGTLATRFDPRSNSLNFLRLVLATSVIIGHVAVLGGYQLPSFLALFGGEIAVDGFFGLSGFLITRSWVRRPHWGRYLWHRSVRILPAFWLCLGVTALVIAPLATYIRSGSLDGYWVLSDGPISYLTNNALLWMGQYGISGGPAGGTAFPFVWDGSLWSLYWEFLCYLALGALGVLGILTGRKWIVLALFTGVWMVSVVRLVQPDLAASYFDTGRVQSMQRLSLMFLAGSLLYLYGARISMSARLASVSLLLFAIGFVWTSDYRVIGGLSLVYFLLWVGISLPVRIGVTNDISYGMYIYGMPVQQLLAMAGVASLGLLPYALLGILLTIPFALGSWFLLEKPVLRLKNWSPPPRLLRREPMSETNTLSKWAGPAVMLTALAAYSTLMLRGWVL